MKQDENVKKNIELLEELSKKGVKFDLKICPQCKSAIINILDVVAMYSPLAPARCVCKNCGWVGRSAIEMINRQIDELDEEILEDILAIMAEEVKDE